jgi:hypothetical protein
MKAAAAVAVSAAAVLSAAAVWMGALNQDEGWYVYAAGMVADGKANLLILLTEIHLQTQIPDDGIIPLLNEGKRLIKRLFLAGQPEAVIEHVSDFGIIAVALAGCGCHHVSAFRFSLHNFNHSATINFITSALHHF